MFSNVFFLQLAASQSSESDIGDENSWGDAALFTEDCYGPFYDANPRSMSWFRGSYIVST